MKLSEKELSQINDMLNEEALLVKKFKMLADKCQEAELKAQLERISQQHQQHFNALYAYL